MFLAFSPETGGDAVALGAHPGVNGVSNRFREIRPLDADVNHLNPEPVPLLGDVAYFVEHFVEDFGAGFLRLHLGQPFFVNDGSPGIVNQGLGANNFHPVALGHSVAQGGNYDVAQPAAGGVFRL